MLPPLRAGNYACGTIGMDLDTLHGCGVTVLSHIDWSLDMEEMQRFIEEAHAHGIKVLPYISPEKAWAVDFPELLAQCNRRNKFAALPYYEAVDPGTHEEWILIDPQGRPAPRYGSYANDDPNDREIQWGTWFAHGEWHEDAENLNIWSWYMCSSAAGYLAAVENGVRALMEMGFDGVFVDNIYPDRVAKCHGAEFGLHVHDPPDANTDVTYIECVRRIHRTVKQFGDEKLVLLNSGRQDVFADARDGSMIESYVVTTGSPERLHNWDAILELANELRDERANGRVVTVLSCIPADARHAVRDNCFYSYACAQLSGFRWTATSNRQDLVRILCRTGMFEPAADIDTRGGLWFRHYENGMVIVNPDADVAIEAQLPIPETVSNPVELYTGRRHQVSGGETGICVFPESGRVIVDHDRALANFLSETAVCLKRAAEAMTEDAAAGTPPAGDWGDRWEDAAEKARAHSARLAAYTDTGDFTGTGESDAGDILEILDAIHTVYCICAADPDRMLRSEQHAAASGGDVRIVESWSRGALPGATNPLMLALLGADEAACRAAALITDLEIFFEGDPPELHPGHATDLTAVLANHGTGSWNLTALNLDVLAGLQVTGPGMDEAYVVQPADWLELPFQVRVPNDSRLTDGHTEFRIHAAVTDEAGRAAPCCNWCGAKLHVSPSGDEPEPAMPSPGEPAMPR